MGKKFIPQGLKPGLKKAAPVTAKPAEAKAVAAVAAATEPAKTAAQRLYPGLA